MTREYTEEQIVLAMDILTYMSEHKVTSKKAYEEIGVSKEMQLSEDELEEIREKYLV